MTWPILFLEYEGNFIQVTTYCQREGVRAWGGGQSERRSQSWPFCAGGMHHLLTQTGGMGPHFPWAPDCTCFALPAVPKGAQHQVDPEHSQHRRKCSAGQGPAEFHGGSQSQQLQALLEGHQHPAGTSGGQWRFVSIGERKQLLPQHTMHLYNSLVPQSVMPASPQKTWSYKGTGKESGRRRQGPLAPMITGGWGVGGTSAAGRQWERQLPSQDHEVDPCCNRRVATRNQ